MGAVKDPQNFSPKDIRDDEVYPLRIVENAEEIYDTLLVKKISEAHELAARYGIPIVTMTVLSDDLVGEMVTIKNAETVPVPVIVGMMMGTGQHPRVAQMLAAAVAESRDPDLAHRLNLLYAKAMDLNVEGMKPHEVRARVYAAMNTNPDEIAAIDDLIN